MKPYMNSYLNFAATGPSMFLEKLPREICSAIYRNFREPTWSITVKRPAFRLTNNSLDNCLSEKLLIVCAQIRNEYQEDVFKTVRLNLKIKCSSGSPMLAAGALEFGILHSLYTELALELSLGDNNTRIQPHSIARNIKHI